ncbi:GUN4 domain-containing protein [Limnothrix redekei]|uniref:GUN4 domain-containing protein n=1 Tax=Limnothrix redekei LRLZ20PSL1 TaxID=3112953 RepID=A0ABW7C8N9_9CYAN
MTIAMRRGLQGITFVILALKSPSLSVQQAAIEQLLGCTETIALEALWQHFQLPDWSDRARYHELQSSLANQQWQAADDLTISLIKKISDRSGLWLRNSDLQGFPQHSLITLDRLWRIYSRDRFGFSIQAQLWNACKAKTCKPFNYFRDNLCRCFGDAVGWKVETYDGRHVSAYDFKRRAKIPYDLSAPIGHLPSTFALGGGESQSEYDRPDTESTMGFYGFGRYYYTWSKDSFFGHDFLREFFLIVDSIKP